MYKVIWCYDGCPGEDATYPVHSVQEAKHFIRVKQQLFKDTLSDPKASLEIVDLETGRLISYLL